jgi:outer membrane protein TolC
MNWLVLIRGRLSRASFILAVQLAGGLLLFHPAWASDPASSYLGLDEAAELAISQQPQLLAQQAAVAALSESAPAAGQLPDPKLRLGVVSLPVDTFDFTQEPMTQAVVGISQMIPGGDKRRLSMARIEREAAQGSQSLAAIERRIGRDARLAWLDLYWPGVAGDLVEQVEAEYLRQVEWSEVAYQTGKLTQEETLALRGMLESTRDRLAELSRQQARARSALARWIGQAADRNLQTLPAASPPPPLARLLEGLEQHPELTVLDETIQVARAEVDLAKEAYKPDWSVDLGYGLRGGDRPDFVSVVVGVDLPVFTGNRQDRRLAARLAGAERAAQMRSDRQQALKAELEAAYADWQAADARIRHYEQDILPLAVRRVESALAAYSSDRASYGRVLEARRAEIEARLLWQSLQVARARALVQISYYRAP